MFPATRSLVVLGIVVSQLVQAEETVVSCSKAVIETSPCDVSRPAGLFSYTQTWDQAQERWLAGHLRLLNCDGSEYRCEAESGRLYDSVTVSSWLGDVGDHTNDGQHRVALSSKADITRYVTEQWSETGACISTLHPVCTSSDSQFGIRLFYRVLDKLSSQLDTARFLAAKRIYASPDHVYDRDRLLEALFDGSEGKHPNIECEGDALKHVEYRFIARGPFQDLQFEPPEHIPWSVRGVDTTCPLKGIKYKPKVALRRAILSTDSKIRELPNKRTPSKKSLKFFKHRYGAKMPDEDVWKTTVDAKAGSGSRARDEL